MHLTPGDLELNFLSFQYGNKTFLAKIKYHVFGYAMTHVLIIDNSGKHRS